MPAVLLAAILLVQDPVPDGKLRWRWAIAYAQNVLVAGDAMVVQTSEGLAGIDPYNGKERWSVKLPGIMSSPALGRRHVYAPGGMWLAALNVSDGKEVWRWQDPGINVTPLVLEGALIVRLADRIVGRSFDNKILWESKAPGQLFGGLQETVWVVAANALSRLDAGSGKEKWQAKAEPGHMFLAAWGDTQTVCASTMDGLLGFEAARGKPLWTAKIGMVSGSVEFDTDRFYAAVRSGDKGAVVALDRRKGTEAWRIETKGQPKCDLRKGVLYCAGAGEVTAVDPATGRIAWTAQPPSVGGDSGIDMKLVESGVILQYGGSVSLTGYDGKVVWKHRLSNASAPPHIARCKDIVVVGRCDAIQIKPD